MKRKLLAGLMATGLALSVSTATINNNEDNSSFNISNNTTLYQSKLQKNDLSSIWDNYNKTFNNMSFDFNASDAFGSDFWCGWLGSCDRDHTNFGEEEIFDYIDEINKKMIKIINDNDGNVFAVIVMEYDENSNVMYGKVASDYNLDTFRRQDLDEVWGALDRVPLRFNLYISNFAGKEMKFNSQNYTSYINSTTQKDLSFLVAGILGYDGGRGSVSYTNEQLGLYINPNIQKVNVLENAISLQHVNNPLYEILDWGLSVGYESVDSDYPSINGNATYYFSVDSAKSFDYIKSTITAYDETEGDITNKIQFTNTDNYSLDNLELKTYNFTASVSDESGHTATQDFQIVIKDVTAPTISSINKEVSYASKLTQEEIKNLFTYSDNYNITTDLTFEIVSDNYTNSYNEIGEHQITARVTDKSGNHNEATATIDVVDKIAPIFACATSYEISTISSKNITLDKLVFSLGITANDVIDGPVVVSLEDLDNYSKNLGKAGSYTIRAIASDSHNNTATTEFELNVVDNDYPVISVNSPYCIIVQEGELITESIIKNVLIASGQISEDEAKTLHIESSVLRMNSISAGSYDLKLKFDSGRENTIILNVNESLKENANVTNFKNTLKEQFCSAVDNIANISQWNWMNWAFLGSSLITILVLAIAIRKKIKK